MRIQTSTTENSGFSKLTHIVHFANKPSPPGSQMFAELFLLISFTSLQLLVLSPLKPGETRPISRTAQRRRCRPRQRARIGPSLRPFPPDTAVSAVGGWSRSRCGALRLDAWMPKSRKSWENSLSTCLSPKVRSMVLVPLGSF